MSRINEGVLELQKQWNISTSDSIFSHPLVHAGIYSINLEDVIDCFAAGTMIRLADGSTKPVEELKVTTPAMPDGDILISADGVRTYVVGLAGGRELNNQGLIKITAKGKSGPTHSITVCSGHTFVKGYINSVRSSLLRVGDRVQSSFVESTITDINFVPYDGSVIWDIYLASEEFVRNAISGHRGSESAYSKWFYTSAKCSLMGLRPRQHLIFANDFLVGDLNIQTQVNEIERAGINVHQLE